MELTTSNEHQSEDVKAYNYTFHAPTMHIHTCGKWHLLFCTSFWRISQIFEEFHWVPAGLEETTVFSSSGWCWYLTIMHLVGRIYVIWVAWKSVSTRHIYITLSPLHYFFRTLSALSYIHLILHCISSTRVGKIPSTLSFFGTYRKSSYILTSTSFFASTCNKSMYVFFIFFRHM